MNELKGKFVNIVLSIEEGRGFDSVRVPLYITANFNGRVMESDMMDAHPDVVFNTEMVWETEKKLLRRARGAYSRIRLECYTEDKRFVGFALLCLRSAKILPSSRTDFTVQYTWSKLLNVPTEFKKGNPELNVSLTIRDYLTSKVIPPALPGYDAKGVDLPGGEGHKKIPVKYTANGYIKVGSDDEQLEKYVFKITAKVASNLDMLLPESVVFSTVAKKYYLSFLVFGMNVKTRHVTRDLHENINVNETVVINLLSNFNNLGMYFDTYPKIPVTFYNDETKLGWTEITIKNMGWDMENAVFHNWCDGKLELEEESFFENDSVKQTPGSLSRCPTLTTKTTVELKLGHEEGQGESVFVSPRVRYSSCMEGELLQDSKSRLLPISEKKNLFLQNLSRIEEKTDPSTVALVQSPLTSHKTDNPLDPYKRYCVAIMFDSIIWRRPVKSLNFIFNFVHPKTNSLITIKTEIDKKMGKRLLLENALCKLNFVCSKSRIGYLLQTNSVKVQLLDSKDTPVAQEFTLDCTKISENKPEHSQVVILKTPKGEDLAELNVCMFLETSTVKQEGSSCYDLLPHIVDENIVFQDLDELEKWKDAERAKFCDEIEKRKREELECLRDDWNTRRIKLENDLRNNIARCKKLSHELKKSAHNMSLDKLIDDRREEDDEFNLYLEIHKNTVKYSLCENHELIEKISELERDTAILRDLLSEQNMEMQEMKKCALTGEQTKNLLQDLKALEEKYEEAQKDKNYFKAEWDKAAKEVHKLKIDNQKSIQDKIAIEKEQLSQLSLDTFISMDDT